MRASEILALAVERATGELIALPGPRYQRRHRRGHDISRQCGIGAGDYVDHDGHRIAPIIGRTLGASGTSVPIPDVDRSGLTASRAPPPPGTTAPAVPVLATALQCA